MIIIFSDEASCTAWVLTIGMIYESFMFSTDLDRLFRVDECYDPLWRMGQRKNKGK